jgi:gluconolactonase
MATERVLADGFAFPEGPSAGPDGDVYVVELAGGRVTRVEPDGTKHLFASLGGSPNGSAFGPDGCLYVANGGGRWAAETCTGNQWGPADGPGLVQRVRPDGSFETVVAEIDGQPLSAPNDICFAPDGGYWFTDPSWPDASGVVGPGSICYVGPDGIAVRAHTGLRFPNGLGVTAAGDTLIVAESTTFLLQAFPIRGPGRLGPPERFGALDQGALPDGLCFDDEGRVLCAGHGASALYVFPPGGGEPEEVVPLDDRDITNVCFGLGSRSRTLYVTESDVGRLVTLDWRTSGMVLHPARSPAGG